jgi:hypothetical protein
MNDLIEKIGPILGIVAFLGLAILAFLIIQQAREVRRLREWAGRAPERAEEAAEASQAAAEARGDAVEEETEDEPGRIGTWWAGVKERWAPRYAELDRRMPVDPRYLLAVLAAGIVAAAVLTSGFGIFGGEDGGGGAGGKAEKKEEKIEVAVLNATQEETATGPIAGVQGLAGKVADKVVKPAGYKAGAETDATSGLPETVIMFDDSSKQASENEKEAGKLADAVADDLGETNIVPMTAEVSDLAKGAPLALVIGADDADF